MTLCSAPAWNWNPDPSRVVFMDLETQSAADLKAVGAKAYLADPTTRLMSAVFLLGDAIHVWVPPGRSPGDVGPVPWPEGFEQREVYLHGDVIPPVPVCRAIHSHTFVAHNAAGFDAPAWARLVGGPQPSWCDTLPLARAAGLPGGLDALGQVLLGRGKDEHGRRCAELLFKASIVSRDGKPVTIYNPCTKSTWQGMLAYNVADVLLLERVFHEVRGYAEPDTLAVHSAINSRGLGVDVQLLARLSELWEQLQSDATGRVAGLTGGEITEGEIRSGPKVKAWLRRLGLNVDSLNRKELERLYADPEDYFGEIPDGVDIGRVVELLKARQTATRISKGKIEAIGKMTGDGRVRDVLVYHGAHTGRWSGRGFQPHNLSRGVSDLDVEGLVSDPGSLTLDTIREATTRCERQPSVDDALSTLLRPVFVAGPGKVLLICDYAAVEARGIAWVAGQDDLLELFASGADIYCDMASRIFGRPVTKENKLARFVGKETVLGCGYNMGSQRFAAGCKLKGIDLAAAGTTAEACVDAYRDAYPRIAGLRGRRGRHGGLWQAYHDAAYHAVLDGRTGWAGECAFDRHGSSLRVVLPSGRHMVYRGAAIADRVPGYAKLLGVDVPPRPTLVYTHHHGYEGQLYGGLLAENIVQAVCRDLLAAALVRCEAEGLPVVLHVHDEIVCEVPEGEAAGALYHLAEMMSHPPEWAAGFPIEVKGFACKRFVKEAFKGSLEVEARGGKVL